MSACEWTPPSRIPHLSFCFPCSYLVSFTFGHGASFNLVLADQRYIVCRITNPEFSLAMPTRDSGKSNEKTSIAPPPPALHPAFLTCLHPIVCYRNPGPGEGRLERDPATERQSLAYLEQAVPRRPPAVCSRCSFSGTAGSCCTGQRSPAEKRQIKLIKIHFVNLCEPRIYIPTQGARRSWPRSKCGEMIRTLCNRNKLTHRLRGDAKTMLFNISTRFHMKKKPKKTKTFPTCRRASANMASSGERLRTFTDCSRKAWIQVMLFM